MTTPTNREAVDWEKQFDERFHRHFHSEHSDYYFTESEIKQFIRQTHLDLLSKIGRDITEITANGYDCVCVENVKEYFQKLSHIITHVEGGTK